MKTNKKLTLNDLKVESFITSMESPKINTIKGGSSTICAAVAGYIGGRILDAVVDKVIEGAMKPNTDKALQGGGSSTTGHAANLQSGDGNEACGGVSEGYQVC